MATKEIQDRSRTYLNPYAAGIWLGLVLLMTFYITGRGLGASGSIKTAVASTVNTIAPKHAQQSHYLSQFITADENPMNNWLTFEVIGVLAGALISGALAGRLKLKVEHSPNITSQRRLVFATLGGLAFGIGSQFGRGCTSGAALSGMASLAAGGFIAMLSIFGAAYAFAYFFRKNWI